MKKIQCRQDKVFTTSDGREHTEEKIAIRVQRRINYDDAWERSWKESVGHIRFMPTATAYYGNGSTRRCINRNDMRNYVYNNLDTIKQIIDDIEKVDIQYETK